MHHYNRKERRQLAKQLGLKKKYESPQEKSERISRSIAAGKVLHQQYQMMVENDLRTRAAEREAKAFQNLVDQVGEDKAIEIIKMQRMISEEQEQKDLLKQQERKNNKE